MNESNVLITNNLHLINQSKATQIIPQLLFSDILIQSAEVDIPAGVALLDSQRNLARHRRRLSPTDLELLSVKGELLDQSVRVERGGGSAVQERKEYARLFWKYTDRFERSKVDEVEKFVNGSGCGQIADIDCTSRGVILCVHDCAEGSG